jgi:iron complex outermembrane receptor protein
MFAEDHFDIGAVTLTVGNKGFQVRNKATPIISGGLASGKIGVTDWFQPSVGAVWHLNSGELFAGFTQVTRAYPSASTAGPFATTQAGFNALNLKPEQSDTYEAGYRFHSGGFSGVLATYLVEFRNRLLSFSNGAGIVGNPAILQNVGGVESYGVEAAGQYKIMDAVTLFASYAYNNSQYQDDVLNANGTVRSAIKGKTVVDAPKSVGTAEIAYDDKSIFGRIGANYMSRRYFTYTNDQSVPGRVLVDASIGYRFSGDGPLKGLEIQGNVTNLFDKKYVATIGSNGFGDKGDNQTLLAGSPQTFFVTVRKAF